MRPLSSVTEDRHLRTYFPTEDHCLQGVVKKSAILYDQVGSANNCIDNTSVEVPKQNLVSKQIN